jgi:hypothetical protein
VRRLEQQRQHADGIARVFEAPLVHATNPILAR